MHRGFLGNFVEAARASASPAYFARSFSICRSIGE
jgi:hypothetical protein